MHLRTYFLIVLIVVTAYNCTSTRYLTDQVSIDRQHDMRRHRTGGNVGDVFLNIANLFISATLNSGYEVIQSERAFKRITVANQLSDTLQVNMVTDVLWKDDEYCDIMGIILPPGAKQKLLVPYPAAYNIYFKTSGSEEEKLEIQTDSKVRVIKLGAEIKKEKVVSDQAK